MGKDRASEAALTSRLVDSAPMIVMIVDDQGRITWLGGALERLTGYRPEELLGTGILEHIDLGWNPAALESVAFAMIRQGLQRPMLFRVVRKDGSSFVAEVTANAQMDDPVVGGLVAFLRRWDERYLLDLVIEQLAADVALDQTLRLLVEVMGAETLEADGAILVEPFAGHFSRVVASPHVTAGLRMDDGLVGTPWHQASLTGQARVMTAEQLPEPLRSQAEQAGYRSCWAFPVLSSGGPGGRPAGGPEACLVLWRRDVEEPDFTCRVLLENLVRVTGLVLARERDAASLRHAASHDALTGLANRSRFFEHVAGSLGDEAAGPLVGLLYVDLDHFKPVNDQFGHGAGDRVLVEVARRLRDVTRDGDLVARLGGDEFAVLCPGVGDREALGSVARRLRDAVCQPIRFGDEEVLVGATVGMAVSPPGEATIDQLIEAADGALYAAKRDARGSVRLAGS